MALRVGIDIVAGGMATIPYPSRPVDNGDISDPQKYIPVGMNKEDREALREAALEWSDTLGGIAARNHPTKGQAGQNMYHYRHGKGQDRKYTRAEVDDLQNTLTVSDKEVDRGIVGKFVDLVAEDMRKTNASTKRYLAKNLNKNNNWFGVSTANGTEWFYGVGSFLMAYGAYAVRRGKATRIHYRMYVYDRYNWDIEPDGVSKSTTIPNIVEVIMDEDEIEDASDINFRRDQKYFEKIKGGNEEYIVTDALFGALMVTDGAKNFDIVGNGSIHVTVIPDDEGESQPAADKSPSRPPKKPEKR